MPMRLVPIILAGGFGTRLRPISTDDVPKQFIKFCSTGESLFERTIKRVRCVVKTDEIIVVCNKRHIELVEEQLKNVGEANYVIIAEPIGKNTFISLLLAMKQALIQEGDILFVSPSDSYIENIKSFSSCFETGIALVKTENKHVLFGVKPSEINANYGYIEVERVDNENEFCKVKSFHEKPDFETAKKFFEDKNFLWNSGSFIFSADLLLKNVKEYSEEDFDLAKKMPLTSDKRENVFFPDETFNSFSPKQIDKTILEKNKYLLCLEATFDWCDVGTKEVFEKMQKDGKIIIK